MREFEKGFSVRYMNSVHVCFIPDNHKTKQVYNLIPCGSGFLVSVPDFWEIFRGDPQPKKKTRLSVSHISHNSKETSLSSEQKLGLVVSQQFPVVGINLALTFNSEKDRKTDFGLCVNLTLVLSFIPELSIFDLERPGF